MLICSVNRICAADKLKKEVRYVNLLQMNDGNATKIRLLGLIVCMKRCLYWIIKHLIRWHAVSFPIFGQCAADVAIDRQLMWQKEGGFESGEDIRRLPRSQSIAYYWSDRRRSVINELLIVLLHTGMLILRDATLGPDQWWRMERRKNKIGDTLNSEDGATNI